MSRLLGAVLAGGRSSRFGSDKALALLDGITLLDRAIATLAGHVDQIVVCGRKHATLPTIDDRPAPDMGPLGGLNAALHFAGSKGFDAVLTTGCDIPSYPRDVAALIAEGEAAVFEDCHILGYWPARLGDRLGSHLANATDLSIRHWIDMAQARRVRLDRPPTNINTPADLARLG